MIYAHSVDGESKDKWESLEDHSKRVAIAARDRAKGFGGGDLAFTIGLLHDLGKSKPQFQRRICGENIEVNHSGEGAKALLAKDRRYEFLAGTITGHHGKLPNPDRLEKRLHAAEEIPLPRWCEIPSFSLPERICENQDQLAFRLQFLARMLYGSLCDADDRKTREFYHWAEGNEIALTPATVSKEIQSTFNDFMMAFNGDSHVNNLRNKILEFARNQASKSPGPFTMTVPTGGGKTLTSLGFGLDHALHHGLKRLIYVIPYTSIIEQTAEVFRQAVGVDAVLEHHSLVDWNGNDETEAEQCRIIGDSWDMPIVVTSAVQFFESLFSARKKRCRKLPSIAQSVIVIDEAQTLPLGLLRPCLAVLKELMDGYGASVVLCTATQPALTEQGGFPTSEALEGAREIAPDPPKLFAALKRVEFSDLGEQSDKELSDRICARKQVLVIDRASVAPWWSGSGAQPIVANSLLRQ